MRYSPAVITLALAAIGFLGAVALVVGGFAEGRTGGAILVGVALGLASFIAAAWAAGRIRRIRSIRPEAITVPPDGTPAR